MLTSTLESVVAQHPQPAGGMEVVVVDNSQGNSDYVRRLTTEMADGAPMPLRYVHEPVRGLGFARNTGIAAAQGEVIAFVDDDAVVDPTWVVELLRVYDETDAAVVGGRVDPIWEGERPSWLGEELYGYLSLLNYGAERKRCTFPNYPFGVNISFHRKALEAVGTFSTSLGGGGAPTYLMDEIDLCQRIERAGFQIMYTPTARVGHLVPRSRQTRSYFLRRAIVLGRSTARMGWVPSGRAVAVLRSAKGEVQAAIRAARHAGRALLHLAGRRERGFVSESRHVIWNASWMWETGLLTLKGTTPRA
jgi:GT2 family glycosyltransferase